MKIWNKKGNVHIDWVISISIFLTFMIILLSFIKPGYEPKFEGDVLIDMVADNFNEKVNWKVYKTMLNFVCETKGIININLKEEKYIPDVGNIKIIEKDKNSLGQEVLANYKGKLMIELKNSKDKFWVIHNTLEGYNLDNMNLVDDGPIDPKDCTIGAANPLIFEGIKESKLNVNDLKMNEWDFPEFRQFRIKVMEPNGNILNCFAKQSESDCKLISIPDDIPVYSANVGDIILDKDLNQKQVILNIEVW